MDNLRIFLGDLTYDTVAISTEAMPLNVGYVKLLQEKIW